MKKRKKNFTFLPFLFCLLYSTSLFSQSAPDLKVGGSLTVDFFTYAKAKSEKQEIGLARIDGADINFKVSANRLFAYFKLDLDDSSLGKDYNIIEEAYLTYSLTPSLNLVFGKNKVPWQLMHAGALKNSWSDATGVTGTSRPDLYWTDIDNKHVLTLEYIHKTRPALKNYFTMWGHSSTTQFSEAKDKIITASQKTFSPSFETGLANLLSIYATKNLNYNLGLIYYKNDAMENASYAASLHANYTKGPYTLWAEIKYGKGSPSRAEKSSKSDTLFYAYESQNEYSVQVGSEISLRSPYSFLINFEAAKIERQGLDADTSVTVDDHKEATLDMDLMQFRLDAALKKALNEKASCSLGAIAEYASVDTTQAGIVKNRIGVGADMRLSYKF